MSTLGRCYAWAYQMLAGRHPRPWPWHFQWLVSWHLRRALEVVLPQLHGRVLDVGCGDKPYSRALGRGSNIQVTGIDVVPSPQVDVLVAPQGPWPFTDAVMDGALCTETLEHVADLGAALEEIRRVLKPGGCLIVSAPFLYNAHGLPHDYRRFTREGLCAVLAKDFDISRTFTLGGIGSVNGQLALNWLEVSCNLSFPGRILKGLLLPLWLVLALVINLLAVVVDGLDRSGIVYSHVLVVARAR